MFIKDFIFKSLLVSFVALLSLGCKESSHDVLGQDLHFEALRFLDNLEAHESRVEIFLRGSKEPTEKAKMLYLIRSLKQSNLTFIRNGQTYKSSHAARWLMRKIRKKQSHREVHTAWDFVNYIARCSMASGESYKVQFEDGAVLPVHPILSKELAAIELALKKRALKKLEVELETSNAAEKKIPVLPAPLVATA